MLLKKKLALAIFLVMAAVLGTVAAVSAFTGPLEFTPRKANLRAELGSVEIRRAGSQDWKDVSNYTVYGEMEVREGDSIRTGPDSAATIDYFEQGQARLDADTTVTFEKLRWDSKHPTTFVGEVLLDSGRLWSRLLDFLTPESSYVARTANTVATVRGTAFSLTSIPKGYEGVFVAEHQVDLSVRQGTAVAVRQGTTAGIDRNPKAAKPATLKNAAWDEKEGAWIAANLPKDRAFDDQVAQRRLDEAKRLISVSPSSPIAGLMKAAEEIRLAATFNSDDKNELRQRFLARRLLAAYVSAEEGRTEEAKALIASSPAGEASASANADVGMATSFLAQRPGMLRDDVIKAVENAAPAAAGVMERIKDRRLEFEDIRPKPEPAPSEILKPSPLLPTSIAPPQETKPSATNTNAVAPAPIFEPAPIKPASTPASLQVSADMANLPPGGKTALHAMLMMSDGSQADVTKLVRWNAAADADTGLAIGAIQGNVFISNNTGGKSVVSAVYSDASGSLAGKVDITVLILEIPLVPPLQ
ncbi:MAG: hypothetical protein AAB692_01935 [Patescibacteria group bacterium]